MYSNHCNLHLFPLQTSLALFFYIQVVSWIFSHSKLTKLQRGLKTFFLYCFVCHIQPKMSRWKIHVLKSLRLRYTAPICSSGSVRPLHPTGTAASRRRVTDAPLKLVGTFLLVRETNKILVVCCCSVNVVSLNVKMLV